MRHSLRQACARFRFGRQVRVVSFRPNLTTPTILARLPKKRSIRTAVVLALQATALLQWVGSAAQAQTARPAFAEAGRFFVQNFSPRDYGEHNANWAVAQDSAGLIYVANTNGVLIYDGAVWQTVPVANHSVVRSLAVGADGRVFVGAYGEIGYLEPDSLGALRYRSLVSRLSGRDREFTNVWQTFVTSHGVYFMAPERLIRWTEEGGMDVFPAGTSFHVSFLVDDTIYLRQREVGLLRLTEGGLELVPGGERFAEEIVFVVLPFGDGGLLAVTRTLGAFTWDGNAFEPFPTAADAFLAENLIYHGALLPDGTFALGTERGGVVVIDAAGRVRAVLDKSSGLRAQKVAFVFPDRAGGVWLALDSGISRIEVPSPITTFGDGEGLEGVVQQTVRHEGTLYAATTQGLYRLRSADGAGVNARFERVPGIDMHCFALVSTEQGLVVGCQDFTHVVRDDVVRVVRRDASCFTLLRSPTHPDWIYEGLDRGLALLRLVDGQWVSAGHVQGTAEQIFGIQEGPDESVWLGTAHQGAVRLRFNGNFSRPPRIERFDSQNGLPDGWANPFRFRDQVLYGTGRGLFRLEGGRFVPDSTAGVAFADGSREAFLMRESADGSAWLYAHPHVVRVSFDSDGEIAGEELPLTGHTHDQAYHFLPEDDGVLWISRADGLVRLDPSVSSSPEPPFAAHVRGVVALEGNALVRGFAARAAGIASLPFARNSLRFHFGAPTYDDVTATRYQYRLDGVDGDWSDWTTETFKDYTQLREGHYRFRVRARSARGVVGREAAVSVSILPPWYRAWWIRLLYVLGGAGLIIGLVRWRSLRLEQQKRHLQRLVNERTTEIEQQRAQLAAQARQLLEHDEMKSRFFSNISHEFRTPLTLTIGPLDDLESGLYGPLGPDAHAQVSLALRNARRLLRLINQLLDVARIESGRMTLESRPGDLAAFLRAVAVVFEPLAVRRDVAFEVALPDTAVPTRFDPDQLEKVFGNLLSNAFKFTPPGGRLRLALDVDSSAEHPRARVTVADSGPGIPPEQLPRIFDRFYQVESGQPRPHGTGIGLSLAAELVQLHGGEIGVESEEGRGATFTVFLPLLAEAPADTPAPDVRLALPEDGVPAAGVGIEPIDVDGEADAADVTTVMVVDDDADIRAYVRRHLATRYRVVEYGDGASALAAVPDVVPDLIVCDVMMPGMDGIAFCSALKSDPEHDFIPVVLLTARADRADRLAGWGEGADDYVTKPFDMTELEARIHNLIATRQRLRQHARPSPVIDAAVLDLVSSDDAYVARVREAVEEGMGDSAFSVEALAEAVGQSRVHLYRRINTLLGTTPSDLIREVRIARARRLLEARAGTISEVAYGVGFKSVSHFSRCFRDATGMSPTQYVDGNRESKIVGS